MIVRILGEGQLQVPDSAAAELNQLDAALETAVEQDDEAGFRQALTDLLATVKAVGAPADASDLRPSELIIPQQDASMAEVRQLLGDEGLIPG